MINAANKQKLIAHASATMDVVSKVWAEGEARFARIPFDSLRKMESSRLFVRIIAVATFVLFVWATFAHIDRVVRVEGKIIPAGRSQEIQHLEGGIVESIDTTEGALVKRGDLLLTINDTAAGVNLGETKSKLANERIRSLRLEAEAKGLDVLEFPPDLADQPEIEGERNLFLSRKAKLEQELLVHQSTIQHHKAELEEANSRKARLTQELDIAHKRSSMLAALAAKEAASRLEVLEAQSRESRLATELSTAQNAVPTLKTSIAEEEARISTVKADFRSQAQNELVTVHVDMQQLEQALTAASDRVNRTEVRSPIDGTINRIAVNTVGGVVKPGETLVEIIPHTSQILVEAKAQPRDRGYLRPGLKATVRVSAYDIGELGVLKGRVTEVSADTVQETRGDPYFRVNILVDAVPASYNDRPMVPGMTVSGDIVTGRRTILSHLLSPLSKFTYETFRDSR